MWIYVNDYSSMNENPKSIIYQGDLSSSNMDDDTPSEHVNSNPSIWFRGKVNTLRVIIGLETDYEKQNCAKEKTAGSCKENEHADHCDVEHFPLQRWVNVNISLRNNVIDIFMDGSLHKSCILKGAPTISKKPLYICKGYDLGSNQSGGFNGYLSKVRYSNKALSSETIMGFYNEGPVTEQSGSFLSMFNIFG